MTGCSGFIGTRLLGRLLPHISEQVYCLVHSRADAFRARPFSRPIDTVEGGVNDVAAYAACLARCDTVVHLAAATGNADSRRFEEVNVQGTARLLDACRQGGVRNIVFLSTIAVTFSDKTRYYYAQSKQDAERLVRDSGLNFLIVRPTIVVGAGGKAWEGLRRLAALPCVVVFGDGRVLVQPIYVDDLVTIIGDMILTKRYHNDILDVGGPERVSMIEFLRRIHLAHSGKEPFGILKIPLGMLAAVLTLVETVVGPRGPLSVGQLASFKNDGCADHRNLLPGGGATTTIARMISLALREERDARYGSRA
jgi:NADH dehydrogenase